MISSRNQLLMMAAVLIMALTTLATPAVTVYPPPDDYCPLNPDCDCTVEYGLLDCSGNNWENLENGVLLNGVLLGDDRAREFFGSVRVLSLDETPVHSLPSYEELTDHLPNLQVIILGENDMINCTHVDRFRQMNVVVLNQNCPPNEAVTDQDKGENQAVPGPNENDEAVSEPREPQNPTPISIVSVPTADPSDAIEVQSDMPLPVLTPVSSTTAMRLTTETSPDHKKCALRLDEIANLVTMIYVCTGLTFIAGMGVGVLASQTLPGVVRLVHNVIQVRCTKKPARDETCRFQPLLSQSSFLTGQSDTRKGILSSEDV